MEAAERETSITWSDADTIAYVFTAQKPIIRRLKKIKNAALVDVQHSENGQWIGENWTVPITAVRLTNPRKSNMSNSQRKAAADRLRAIHRMAAG